LHETNSQRGKVCDQTKGLAMKKWLTFRFFERDFPMIAPRVPQEGFEMISVVVLYII
jgi:hypothetical protein